MVASALVVVLLCVDVDEVCAPTPGPSHPGGVAEVEVVEDCGVVVVEEASVDEICVVVVVLAVVVVVVEVVLGASVVVVVVVL